MILIADSGATKTDWRVIENDGSINQLVTKGLNPYQLSEIEIEGVLKDELTLKTLPDQIHFYGAGCASENNKTIIERVFKKVFNKSEIEVHTDILGAARSLCGSDAGIVCIIGTGTNACIYDGEEICAMLPSLGYVLGDEGSGSWLGKKLISDYFGKRLTYENRKLFMDFGECSKDYILNKVYEQPRPAAFLAGYSKLISDHLHDPYFYKLVYRGFELFLNNVKIQFVDKLQVPLHFTGSVAFIYADILRRVASDIGLYVKNINQSPIAGLTLFHQPTEN